VSATFARSTEASIRTHNYQERSYDCSFEVIPKPWENARSTIDEPRKNKRELHGKSKGFAPVKGEASVLSIFQDVAV